MLTRVKRDEHSFDGYDYEFLPGLQTDSLMAEQVHPAHFEPYGVNGSQLRPLGFSGEGGRGFHHGSKQIHRFNKKPYTLPQTASAIEDLLAIRRRPYIYPDQIHRKLLSHEKWAK